MGLAVKVMKRKIVKLFAINAASTVNVRIGEGGG
jgi:hypothetical protein